MDDNSLTGATSLVTGAAGGIGRAVCGVLHARGARVIAADLSADGLAALAAELPGLVSVVADVGTADGADACLAAAGGRVDVLVNNAGVADGLASIDELDDATWELVLRVNLTSAYLVTNRAVTGMLERGEGRIVNVASVAGIRGGRAGAAYTASKWGLVGLTQNIAATLGAQGVRCNAVSPGSTTGNVTMKSVPVTESGERRRTRDRDRPPAGSPESVADVVAWLLSPEAARLNGIVVPIDDGWTAY